MLQAGGDIFVGRFARLRDVWLDPVPVFDEVGVDWFVGREWLTAEVDRYLRSYDRGHIVIEAAAGLGKTAFAAWLARERGWPCHFTRRRKGRSTATALRNLAAQLIARARLGEEFAPGGALPDTAGEPGWFDQVLRAAAERATGPLVVVVDGLDEAEHPDGDLPLGLPATLPQGVFFVMTCRTGTDLSALRQPRKVLRIDAADRRNTDDLRRFVSGAFDTDGAQAGRGALVGASAPEDLVDTLVRRCGGVWVYARYVLDEIRYGLRTPTELDSLPADLAHYYLESLAPLRRRSDWTTVGLPLLGTLAATAEPLPGDILARLAGVADHAAARALCLGRLRPFLIHSDNADDHHGIYHSSFREFLSGSLPEGTTDGVRAAAQQLAEACRDAHRRITDHYLDLFGGLATGLPALARNPSLAGVDGGYPLRHLAVHLEGARRMEDLHRLLAQEHPTGPNDARNTWFQAHEHADTVEDFLADLRRARRHATAATDDAVAAGRTAPSLKLEIRYALIRSAITTLSSNIPAALLVRLVTSGVWSARRAVAYARRIHVPQERAQSLAALVEHLPEVLVDGVVAEAIDAARTVADGAAKAWALRDIARFSTQPQAVLEEALRAMRDVLDEDDLIAVLVDLADELPDQSVPQAFAVAAGIVGEHERVTAVAALLHRLPAPLVSRVLEIGEALVDPSRLAELLVAVARRLPAHLIADAVDLADRIEDLPERLRALKALAALPAGTVVRRAVAIAITAGCTAADLRTRALILCLAGRFFEAAAVARSISEPVERATTLAVITPTLDPDDRHDTIAVALEAAALIDDEDSRSAVLVTLAEAGTVLTLGSLLRASRTLTDPAVRTRVLSAIADNPEASEEVHARILNVVAAMQSEPDQVRLLKHVAPRLGEQHLAEALLLCQQFALGYHRTSVLRALAPHLPDRLIPEALATSQVIDDQRSHVHLIARVAEHHIGSSRDELITRALDVVDRIAADRWRTAALLRLSLNADADLRSELVDRALRVALTIPVLSSRATASSELVEHVRPQQRALVLAHGRMTISALSDPGLRAWHLGRLAARLQGYARIETLEAALAAARSVPSSALRAALLTTLAAEAGPGYAVKILTEAITVVRGLDGAASSIAGALATMVKVAPRNLQTPLFRALRVVLRAGTSHWRMSTPSPTELVELRTNIARVPERLLAAAIDATAALPYVYSMTHLWSVIALHLDGDLREQALREVLSDARSSRRARAVLMLHATTLWGEDVGLEELALVRRAVEGLDFGDCQHVLAYVPDAIYVLGGDDVLPGALGIVDTIRRWWAPPGSSSAGRW